MTPDPLNNEPQATKSEPQKLDQEITSLNTDFDKEASSLCEGLIKDLRDIHHDFVVMKWIMAFVMVGVVLLLIKTF